MAGITPRKGTERATIDCSMIVATTKEENPRSIAITSGSKIAVEPQVETTEAVKLIVKGVLKAQKPEKRTLTGHLITLTDNLTILEMIEILQGGTLVKDSEPPVSGAEYEPVKFVLDVYSAQMSGSEVIGYEKITYPGCTGQPAGLNSEDNVFRATEYPISSSPASGEAPYKIEYVKELPVVEQTIGTLRVTSAAGSAAGKTKLSVTPAKAISNSYKFKTGASVSIPAYDEVCGDDFTAWNGTEEVTAANGNKILVVELDSENKAKKAGITDVIAMA